MKFEELRKRVETASAALVAVSKTHSPERIREVYDKGQRDFGENKVQELVEKVDQLPEDINWHMIGHLQSNKVKYLASFVHLIHSLDRMSLAKEVNKQGRKAERVIPVLLQIKIAREDSKFGIDPADIDNFMISIAERNYPFIKIRGVMGMATFTENKETVKQEFQELEQVFEHLKSTYFSDDPEFRIKSYGMSADYEIALETGSNMVRVGSLIFGERNY